MLRRLPLRCGLVVLAFVGVVVAVACGERFADRVRRRAVRGVRRQCFYRGGGCGAAAHLCLLLLLFAHRSLPSALWFVSSCGTTAAAGARRAFPPARRAR